LKLLASAFVCKGNERNEAQKIAGESAILLIFIKITIVKFISYHYTSRGRKKSRRNQNFTVLQFAKQETGKKTNVSAARRLVYFALQSRADPVSECQINACYDNAQIRYSTIMEELSGVEKPFSS
jgi:hypothetical protein